MKKNTRRAFLAGVVAAVPVVGSAVVPDTSGNKFAFMDCPRATGGRNAKRFPKVIVQDQYKRKAWFYEDLIADKLVVVSFTSVKGEDRYPVLSNLVKVREIIDNRVGKVGKDVYMYTITTDPYRDSPGDLRALAEQYGATWQFLTGAPKDMLEVLASFNARGSLYGLTWIGNERTGRWIKKPSQLQPLFIAEPVARLATGKRHRPFLVDRHSV